MVQHSLFCSFFSPLPHLFAVVGEGTTGGEQQNQLGVHHVLQRLLTTLRTLDRWVVKQPNTNRAKHKTWVLCIGSYIESWPMVFPHTITASSCGLLLAFLLSNCLATSIKSQTKTTSTNQILLKNLFICRRNATDTTTKLKHQSKVIQLWPTHRVLKILLRW